MLLFYFCPQSHAAEPDFLADSGCVFFRSLTKAAFDLAKLKPVSV